MAILTISEASRRWRLGRSNLYRAIKSGRLNLSARSDGSRGIDTSELVRVFGEPSERTTTNMSALSGEQVEDQEADDREHLRTLFQDDREQARTFSPVRLLKAQVDQLTAQLAQSQQEKARLLAMLETEQKARRELETKLLPAPIKPAPSNPHLWILLLLLAGLGLAIWHWWELIVPYF